MLFTSSSVMGTSAAESRMYDGGRGEGRGKDWHCAMGDKFLSGFSFLRLFSPSFGRDIIRPLLLLLLLSIILNILFKHLGSPIYVYNIFKSSNGRSKKKETHPSRN